MNWLPLSIFQEIKIRIFWHLHLANLEKRLSGARQDHNDKTINYTGSVLSSTPKIPAFAGCLVGRLTQHDFNSWPVYHFATIGKLSKVSWHTLLINMIFTAAMHTIKNTLAKMPGTGFRLYVKYFPQCYLFTFLLLMLHLLLSLTYLLRVPFLVFFGSEKYFMYL